MEQSLALSFEEVSPAFNLEISQGPGLNPDSYFMEITKLDFRTIASWLWGYLFTHFLIYYEPQRIE